MASRTVTCDCGTTFETEASNRRRCYKCSPARMPLGQDPKGVVTPIRPPPPVDDVDSYVPPSAPAGPHVPGRTERVVVAELEKLGAEDTVDGVLAVGFAAALDDQWLPGAQRTSMAKQLQVILDGIRAALPAEKDGVDAYAEAARRLREQAI